MVLEFSKVSTRYIIDEEWHVVLAFHFFPYCPIVMGKWGFGMTTRFSFPLAWIWLWIWLWLWLWIYMTEFRFGFGCLRGRHEIPSGLVDLVRLFCLRGGASVRFIPLIHGDSGSATTEDGKGVRC